MFLQQQLLLLPAVPPVGYLMGVLYGLEDRQVLALLLAWVPWLFVAVGVAGPYAIIHAFTDRALRRSPDDAPGARLRRILSLPRRIEVAMQLCYLTGAGTLTIAACLTYGRPLALEELERDPKARPTTGFWWVRQAWYLPYVILLILLATLTALGVIVVSRSQVLLSGSLASLLLPLGLSLGYVLVVGVYTAVGVARRQRSGLVAVESAVRALASGAPVRLDWLAKVQLDDLALAVVGALDGLRQRALTVDASAHTVDEVARELGTLVARQQQVVATQSTVLLQTQQIAEELRQTSLVASDQARAVLANSEEAERVGRSGRAAVESSLEQLGTIRDQVFEMASQVSGLAERARAIDRITLVVKDLADQSGMVALNAAIEATRAGEHGKAFAVVAQQIRRLADGSSAATDEVRGVLRGVEGSIREAARLSETGMDRANAGLAQAKVSGEDLRRLSEIVVGQAGSTRQISAAVSQQGAAIGQIFEAITALGATLRATAEAMKATEAITSRAERAAREVAGAMAAYR